MSQMTKKPKNIICTLFGHKESDYNDSGYAICRRCQNHEYYDGWHTGIFNFIWWKVSAKFEWWRKEITTKYFAKKSENPF